MADYGANQTSCLPYYDEMKCFTLTPMLKERWYYLLPAEVPLVHNLIMEASSLVIYHTTIGHNTQLHGELDKSE